MATKKLDYKKAWEELKGFVVFMKQYYEKEVETVPECLKEAMEAQVRSEQFILERMERIEQQKLPWEE